MGDDKLSYGQLQKSLGILSSEICRKIDSLTSEVKASVDAINKRIDLHAKTLEEVTDTLTVHSVSIATLEATVKTLSTQVITLNAKCEALEGRQRRKNIRLIGLPEGAEGPSLSPNFCKRSSGWRRYRVSTGHTVP